MKIALSTLSLSRQSSSESNQTYMLKTLLFAYLQKYSIFDGPTTA